MEALIQVSEHLLHPQQLDFLLQLEGQPQQICFAGRIQGHEHLHEQPQAMIFGG